MDEKCPHFNQQVKKIDIRSQFFERYSIQSGTIDIDIEQIQNTLRKNNIFFNPQSSYVKFCYQVERISSHLNYYKIHVKIAHFSLIINVAYSSQNFFKYLQIIQGINSQIYFASFGHINLCFKSFRFQNKKSFGIIFNKIIKEFAIFKICSSLECSVYHANNLGFDIFISEDNHIYFIAERGKDQNFMNKLQAEKLKYQLRLMHKLKIIHFDIKPENIVYSQYYQKPVFIDFGFSQIIEEQQGLKTLTSFRGTPNFCSPQILQILSESEAYIDLYYNDLYGLNQVIKSKKQTEKLFSIEFQQNSIFIIQNSPLSDQVQATIIFQGFKFHYLNHNYQESKNLALQCLTLDPLKIKQILYFVKSLMAFVFIPQLFFKDLLKYNKMIEYIQIEEILKLGSQKLLFKKISLSKENSQDSFHQDKFQYELLQIGNNLQYITFHTQNNSEYYKKEILKIIQKNQSIDIDKLALITFQCIRFDKKNLDLKDKIQIASKFNTFLMVDSSVDQSENLKDLKQIQRSFRYLLKYIFNTQDIQYKWNELNAFSVIEQIILIDANYLKELDDLQLYIQEKMMSFTDLVLVCLQIKGLKQTIKIIDTENIQTIVLLLEKLNKMLNYYQAIIQDLWMRNKDQSYRSIKILYDFVKHEEIKNGLKTISQCKNILQQINNSKIRKKILYFITAQELQYNYNLGRIENILYAVQVYRTSFDVQNLGFMHFSKLNLSFTNLTQSYKECSAYLSYMADIINCPQIFNRLKLVRLNLLDNNGQLSILKSRINYFIKNYKYIILLKHEIQDNLLFQIICRLKYNKIKISKQLNDLLQEVYRVYKQNTVIEQNNYYDSKIYHKLYHESQILYFFYNLSPNTKDKFLQKIKISINYIGQNKKIYSNSQSYQFIFYHIHSDIYLYYFHLAESDYEQCVLYIDQLLQVSTKLRLNFLIHHMLSQIEVVINSIKNEETIIKICVWMFLFCKQENYLSHYFYSANIKYFTITLSCFARSHQNLFHQLILKMTAFLYSFPIRSFVSHFVNSLNFYLAQDPTNGYLLHYSKFSITQLNQNPYILILYAYSLQRQDKVTRLFLLKIIVSKIHFLSSFTKNQIFSKYFKIFLQLYQDQISRRKWYLYRIAKRYISCSDCKKIIKKHMKQLRCKFESKNERNTLLLKKIKKLILYV